MKDDQTNSYTDKDGGVWVTRRMRMPEESVVLVTLARRKLN